MCGRFNLRTSIEGIVQQFLPGASPDAYPSQEPRFNIAPTQNVVCVMQPEVGSDRTLKLMRWGLLPGWANDISIGNRMINARSETASSKPAFRHAMKSQRCIIPADGYYEWKAEGGGKQPYEFSLRSGRLLGIAGLWEKNSRLGGEGKPILSCTILTTSANHFAGEFHDRMPVLLDDDQIDRWLDPGFSDQEVLGEMLKPAPEDWLQRRPVSRRLNFVGNQGASLLVQDS